MPLKTSYCQKFIKKKNCQQNLYFFCSFLWHTHSFLFEIFSCVSLVQGFRGFPVSANAIWLVGAVGSSIKDKGFLHFFFPFSSPQSSALDCQCSVMDDTLQKEAYGSVLCMACWTWSSTGYGHCKIVHLIKLITVMEPYIICWRVNLFVLLCSGIYIPAWFQKGSLPRPPPSVPLILIGPGTGCAPFRGFVEERAIQSSSGPAAPIIFFFGCCNEDDFLYRELWLSHSLNDGVFSEAKGGGFYVAFSRKQPQKVYVQHKMLEQSQRIWNLLLSKASIYVAGSATKMPSDVWSTFEEIISKEGEASRDSAANWLKALQRAGRYHVEAWSWTVLNSRQFLLPYLTLLVEDGKWKGKFLNKVRKIGFFYIWTMKWILGFDSFPLHK